MYNEYNKIAMDQILNHLLLVASLELAINFSSA